MDFVIDVEFKRNVPLFQRVAGALRKAIADGRLAAGEVMPSVRDLASALKISRATALKSLEVLKDEGLTESVTGSGTFVRSVANCSAVASPADDLLAEPSTPLPDLELSNYGERVSALAAQSRENSKKFAPLNYGAPPVDLAPIAPWSSLLLDYCKTSEIILAEDVHANGYQPLTEALSVYLQRARAVRCHFQQVFIFSSKQLRHEVIARTLIDEGDCVAFEEPGFIEAKLNFKSHGARIIAIPIDDEGIDVSFLATVKEKIKLVYVTPARQDPTGRVMSMKRRKELLAWARGNGAYIIEDDYDSEFRYGQEALPSLQGMDSECVIYIASLWKVLFHVLRFGFIVVPPHLVKAFTAVKLQTEQHLPIAEQVTLAAFINQGHLERHIYKARKEYAFRRQALIYALTLHTRDFLTIPSDRSGMHLLLQIDLPLLDKDIEAMAVNLGLPLMSTSDHYEGLAKKGEFIIQFSNIDPDTISNTTLAWRLELEQKMESKLIGEIKPS